MKKKIQEYLTYLTAEYIYIPYDKEELLSLPKDKYTYNNSCLGTLSNGKKIFLSKLDGIYKKNVFLYIFCNSGFCFVICNLPFNLCEQFDSGISIKASCLFDCPKRS